MLDDYIKQYCAFTTYYGFNNLNTLLIGITCAHELFQKLTNKYLGDFKVYM